MKNYRIRKETWNNKSKYFPQRKIFGLFWVNIFSSDYYDGHHSFEDAKNDLCAHITPVKVEHFEVNCGIKE